MNLAQILTLYVHEVRSALRERSIVVFSIIIPIVLYPALLWAGLTAFSFVEGQRERLTADVAVHGLPQAHAPLLDSLTEMGGMTITDWPGSSPSGRGEVVAGGLDVFLEFEDAEDDASSPENFRARLHYHGARESSRTARGRVESVLTSYREEWVDRERRSLGISDPEWAGFAVVGLDRTTPEEGTRFFLGLMVPFLTLIIVALAAFYPAIDATAGERERSTWETLMTVAAPRSSIAAAKYLYVATFGAAGGLLNVAALVLSLRWILQPVAGGDVQEAVQSGIPLSAVPVIAAGTALLGLFVAAGMLVFSVFARNFKEGQSMITPFYLLIILPAIFLQSPDIELTPALAVVPSANVVLLLRESIMGTLPLLEGALALGSMALFAGLAVAFAQWVMRREEVLLGSGEGGLGTFLKRRLGAGGRTP